MPPRPKRRRRGDRHTNVFVQETAPSGRDELDDADESEPLAATDETASADTGVAKAVSASRARRLRAQSVARQAHTRSDVFTRSLGRELRKLGVLSGSIAVILVIVSFVL
jgi:hypothetical protein